MRSAAGTMALYNRTMHEARKGASSRTTISRALRSVVNTEVLGEALWQAKAAALRAKFRED
jgi:hypothetical protein